MSTLDHRTQSSVGLTALNVGKRKRFSRGRRIAWQILAPPVLGVVVMILPVMWWEVLTGSSHSDLRQLVVAAGIYLVGAFLVAGIPSVVFALLMERAFARGLDPSSWSAVALAAALGAVAGLAMVTVPNGFVIRPGEAGLVAVFGVTGLAVGFVVGLVTRWRSSLEPSGAKQAANNTLSQSTAR